LKAIVNAALGNKYRVQMESKERLGQCFTPAILATWEAEIRRITGQGK
jgi:hypothetical protein